MSYNAINGQEAKQAILFYIKKDLDSVPLFKTGNTFHRFHVDLSFIVSAYPADVPVPEAEFSFEFSAPNIEESNFEKALETYNTISKKREELVSILESMDNALESLEKKHESLIEISAGDVPDLLRERAGIPIREVTQLGSGKAEIERTLDEDKKVIVEEPKTGVIFKRIEQ